MLFSVRLNYRDNGKKLKRFNGSNTQMPKFTVAFKSTGRFGASAFIRYLEQGLIKATESIMAGSSASTRKRHVHCSPLLRDAIAITSSHDPRTLFLPVTPRIFLTRHESATVKIIKIFYNIIHTVTRYRNI